MNTTLKILVYTGVIIGTIFGIILFCKVVLLLLIIDKPLSNLLIFLTFLIGVYITIREFIRWQ